MPCRPSTYGKGKWEGDKYKGHWKRGNFHGHGTYTRSDGHKFVGEWKNNVLNDFTEYDKYGNLVRHILIIFSILLLYSPLFGQVDADSSKEFDPTLLSNISISLISEFLKEVEPLPPAGISMDTCIYHIDAVKVKETTFVTFKGKNLNSFGDSKLSGPDGFQESVLKALYRALEDKRKLICDTYGEFIEKCGGVVKKIPAEKIETIREMKKKYDLFEKRIAVLDTRIERMNSAVVADNLILQKGTLFFHYLNNQWGWFMNSNGDKFEGKYFGEIVGLKPHGKGTTTYPNGFKSGDGKVELVGEWKEGEPWDITRYNKSGEITAKWVNGVMVDESEGTGNVQGKAQYKEISNTLYYWETSSGMEWVTIGVDDIHPKYEGETKNDEPNGIGTLTYPNGHKFEGEWNDGEQHGRGTFTWSDGRKYTGMFKNGKPYGQGTYTYLDGTKNLGKWKVTQENFLWKTNKEISTLYHWETSSGMEWVTIGVDDIHPKYEGETKNDEPNGIGTLTYPNGHKFEGEWNDGEQHGRGTFTWSDGRKYTGMFKNGKPYGQGTYTYLDGTKNLGKWKVTQENFLWKINIKIPLTGFP